MNTPEARAWWRRQFGQEFGRGRGSVSTRDSGVGFRHLQGPPWRGAPTSLAATRGHSGAPPRGPGSAETAQEAERGHGWSWGRAAALGRRRCAWGWGGWGPGWGGSRGLRVAPAGPPRKPRKRLEAGRQDLRSRRDPVLPGAPGPPWAASRGSAGRDLGGAFVPSGEAGRAHHVLEEPPRLEPAGLQRGSGSSSAPVCTVGFLSASGSNKCVRGQPVPVPRAPPCAQDWGHCPNFVPRDKLGRCPVHFFFFFRKL